MKKRVYVVDSHHYVIKEWFNYIGYGTHLLSFDYHTDFCKAFIRSSGNPNSPLHEYLDARYKSFIATHIPCKDVDAAIKDLRHDEHIDFAIKSRMIDKAYVFSCDSNSECDGRVLSVPCEQKQMNEAAIISYSEQNYPRVDQRPYDETIEKGMAKIVTTDSVLNEVINTFREYGFNQDNYILDFDCDFIRSKLAMTHGNFETLKTLIKGARVITIAKEPYYVRKCSKRNLKSDSILNWLLALIKETCDVKIEYGP